MKYSKVPLSDWMNLLERHLQKAGLDIEDLEETSIDDIYEMYELDYTAHDAADEIEESESYARD